jgi:hypothetical protein
MIQPNGLHHPDYTEQMPNVKSGQTDLNSAKWKSVGPDSNALEKKVSKIKEVLRT